MMMVSPAQFVAASKMRNAQVAVNASRGIVDPFYRLFGDHPGETSCLTHAYFRDSSDPLLLAAIDVNRDLTLAITSDKGLCGGINSSITRYTKMLMKINAPSRSISST